MEGKELESFLSDVKNSDEISLDTETTGLFSHEEDNLFGISISTKINDYWWRNPKPADVYALIMGLVEDEKLIFMQDAKFDMHFLAKYANVDTSKLSIHCTKNTAKLLDNSLLSYSLDALTGEKKDVKGYMDKHKLFSWSKYGKTRTKKYHFDKVPDDIMSDYAKADSRATYNLGIKQRKNLEVLRGFGHKIGEVYKMEMKLVHVLTRMENHGVALDKKKLRQYVNRLGKVTKETEETFKKRYGFGINERKALGEYLQSKYNRIYKTAKGNVSVASDILSTKYPSSILTKTILLHRANEKTYGTYLLPIKDRAVTEGVDDVIHCNFNQNVTTGRLSCREPNLQNITKNDE